MEGEVDRGRREVRVLLVFAGNRQTETDRHRERPVFLFGSGHCNCNCTQ